VAAARRNLGQDVDDVRLGLTLGERANQPHPGAPGSPALVVKTGACAAPHSCALAGDLRLIRRFCSVLRPPCPPVLLWAGLGGRAPPVAGQPGQRRYRARYVDNDVAVRDWSDTVEVTAHP
jgi:hypothetical protein